MERSMNCAVHPGVEATGYCRNCGKAMCPACTRQVRDVLYCEDCLAVVMGLPPAHPVGAVAAAPGTPPPLPPAPSVRASSSPTVAFFLGFVPGLGAIYNGEYNKALIHIVVFAALIVGVSSDPDSGTAVALGLLIAGFVFYMAIDAMRTARARLDGAPTPDPLENWSKNRPIGPMILIALGAFFLLKNFGFFDFFRVREFFWPVILIGAGLLMLRNRLGNQN
jgi:hypothetical protein